jgi:hypothetical protein
MPPVVVAVVAMPPVVVAVVALVPLAPVKATAILLIAGTRKDSSSRDSRWRRASLQIMLVTSLIPATAIDSPGAMKRTPPVLTPVRQPTCSMTGLPPTRHRQAKIRRAYRLTVSGSLAAPPACARPTAHRSDIAVPAEFQRQATHTASAILRFAVRWHAPEASGECGTSRLVVSRYRVQLPSTGRGVTAHENRSGDFAGARGTGGAGWAVVAGGGPESCHGCDGEAAAPSAGAAASA